MNHYYEYPPDNNKPPKFDFMQGIKASSLLNFVPLLPIKELKVSMGEGGTPLTHLKTFGQSIGLNQVWAKREDLNPTGCFKDRESAVVISAALEQNQPAVHVVSSGNAALSTAAYAQKAGIACTCYVPTSTSQEKVTLMQLFGAAVEKIDGTYENVYRQVADESLPSWNVTTGKNPLRTQANKTIAYELWLDHQVPDVLVVAAGNGGCLAGIWLGLEELKQAGLITKLPKLVAVQVAGASPLQQALAEHQAYSILNHDLDSIAEGIIATESYCSPIAVAALTATNGEVIEVTDHEIATALQQIIQFESIVPEPTTAAVYAALPKISDVKTDDQIVCVHGGTGLKFLSKINQLVQITPKKGTIS